MKASELPRVYLTMPFAGKVCAESMLSLFSASTRTNIDPEMMVATIGPAVRGFGGLAANFNALLAAALDSRDAGIATHMAMLHSDVRAHGHWLNILYGEMQATKSLVMSAVVAFKDGSYRTSTGYAKRGERWGGASRLLEVGNRHDMPDTFTDADDRDDETLLINTGCMLIDLRHEFWDTFNFQQLSIIRRRPDGSRWVDFRSEDWDMSHDLKAAGLRYGSTWKVTTDHLDGGSASNFSMLESEPIADSMEALNSILSGGAA